MNRSDVWSEAKFGYVFQDQRLLEQALTHRSASAAHNERLEFLGDAVLGLVITMALYKLKPDAREGSLSRFRAALVCGETLAEIAGDFEFGGVIQMGSGEQRTGGHQRQSVLANALEAFFGAVLLDGGYPAAEQVIEHVYADRLEHLPEETALKDPKTRLQEWLQARQLPPPEYQLLDVSGAAHAQRFRVSCCTGALEKETAGSGTSRRRAEQAAATAALEQLSDVE